MAWVSTGMTTPTTTTTTERRPEPRAPGAFQDHMVAKALLALSVVVAAVPAWAGSAEVFFDPPDSYTDFKTRALNDDKQQSAMMNELRRHFERNAARHLPEDQTLVVTVRNVDLAGKYLEGHARTDNALYPPAISFNWVVNDADGAPRERGTAELVGEDRAALSSRARLYSDRGLGLEKALIDQWFAGQDFSGSGS